MKHKTLHLTLKKEWFDMILSGEKKEEYREIKEYWSKRLMVRNYDVIHFRNGYSKNARWMTVEMKYLFTGLGKVKWGAPVRTPVFIIGLGYILESNEH